MAFRVPLRGFVVGWYESRVPWVTVLLLPVLLGALAGCDTGRLASAEMREGEDPGWSMGLLDGGMPAADGSTATLPSGESAREVFERDVEPLLTSSCSSCHAVEASGAPLFLSPDPEVYDAVKAWPGLIDLESPSASRLVRKGLHAGPAWSTPQAGLVTRWLEMESAERRAPPPPGSTMADAGPVEEALVTDPILVVEGFNHIDLGRFETPGSSISFVASRIGSGIYVSDLRLSSGPRGLHVKHPVFVALFGGDAVADPVDTFADLDVEVAPGRSHDLGTLVLVECPAGALLTVHFDAVGSTASTMPAGDGGVPDGGGAPDGGVRPSTGACSSVASFTSSARPQLLGNCTRCHDGTNETATAALDMTRVPSVVGTDQTAACAQVLGRVDLDDPDTSAIFLAPDPDVDNGHDFKFESAAELDFFRTALRRWIDTE
ncbi:MAG: hypothetical protein IT379_20380 [Deltaproteobacteria bacterium]|nr:hypothetical protein [Deltaproteobacteria bacterium]